jgi:hypothetical protein
MSTFRSTLSVPSSQANRQNVPKRWHLNYRRRGITQKKAYDIQNTAKVWNQEHLRIHIHKRTITKNTVQTVQNTINTSTHITKTPPHTLTHTLQKKLQQPHYKIHTKWNSHNTIKYPQCKVTLMYMVLLSIRTSSYEEVLTGFKMFFFMSMNFYTPADPQGQQVFFVAGTTF